MSAHTRRSLGGPAGNERLTASTAVLLLALLAAEGVTILFVGPLLSEHVFIGLLLMPPVALKLASTGYRFARYYTRNADYRRAGPPLTFMRLIAPVVVVSTVAVFVTGVALILAGPAHRSLLLPIHKAAFIVWLAFTAVHVLVYLPRIPRLASSDARALRRAARQTRLGGEGTRLMAVGLALSGGLVLAVLALPLAHSWVHAGGFPH
jgi:hypothetical protein